MHVDPHLVALQELPPLSLSLESNDASFGGISTIQKAADASPAGLSSTRFSNSVQGNLSGFLSLTR